ATGWGTAAIAFTDFDSVKPSQELQLAQTPVGACIVNDPTGTPLNVRATPAGKIVGSLPNGTRVILGITDGREGPNWTRIIGPIEGFVWSLYLSNCVYR
ncbi:SH3 domain-containing protein, partial [Limnospira indica]